LTPPLYESLARRYMAPAPTPADTTAAAAGNPVPEPLAHAAPDTAKNDDTSAENHAVADPNDNTDPDKPRR
jgi:hypothetical protein